MKYPIIEKFLPELRLKINAFDNEFFHPDDLEAELKKGLQVYQDKSDRQVWSGQRSVDDTHTALLIGIQKLPEPTFTVTESQVREAFRNSDLSEVRQMSGAAVNEFLRELGMMK